MRHIKKTNAPEFFILDTSSLSAWSDYIGEKKRNLKMHILTNEQFGLCCYCETKISLTTLNCHIEHLKPKSIPEYVSLVFEYNNLAVSCNGNHFNEPMDNSQNTCGHCKDNFYNDTLFLNPVENINIQKYFIYESTKGEIKSSSLDDEKSNYTILILNLNGKNNKLAEARLNAKNALLNILSLKKNEGEKKKLLLQILDKDNVEFISFLRFCFY